MESCRHGQMQIHSGSSGQQPYCAVCREYFVPASKLAEATAAREAAEAELKQAYADWLADRNTLYDERDKAETALAVASEALASASEEGYLGHSGSCQGPYGGNCSCGFGAWQDARRSALQDEATA